MKLKIVFEENYINYFKNTNGKNHHKPLVDKYYRFHIWHYELNETKRWKVYSNIRNVINKGISSDLLSLIISSLHT